MNDGAEPQVHVDGDGGCEWRTKIGANVEFVEAAMPKQR
jgi:hypothetical protein